MTPPPEDSEEEEPEEEELPFGGKLAPAEADTRKFTPDEDDRDLFNRTAALSLKAEKTAGKAPDRKSGRKDDIDYGEESMPKISKVQIGDWEIETWYAAPYPEEYNQVSKLFICEFCLKYMKSAFIMNRHKLHCPLKHPPGDEIYRDDNVSVFEVDGRRNKIYCQNLCLIAKMFLDHKTLYYDVEPFLFYVICEYDERGYHFVGYFSKEKRSSSSYNLSCIVTLPTYQRKGYGNLLIELSYLLCRKEGKPGSPEKPLSDLGLLSYRNYWRTATIEALLATEGDDVSISDLVAMTGMTPDDIVNALDLCGFLRKQDDGSYSIEFDATVLEAYMERIRGKGMARVNPAKLRWTPHVWGPQTKPIEPPPKANEDGDGEEEEGGQEDGEEEHGEDGEGAGQETAPDGDGKDEAADDEAKDEGSPAADAGDDDPMAVDQPEGGLDPEDAEE
ncbi:acyl-CoA N-acyltransferase [Hyaloraphidium curvatum]|nr:acyl-CoA N-acyltransferase [Hyaloraphidium curvatum]